MSKKLMEVWKRDREILAQHPNVRSRTLRLLDEVPGKVKCDTLGLTSWVVNDDPEAPENRKLPRTTCTLQPIEFRKIPGNTPALMPSGT